MAQNLQTIILEKAVEMWADQKNRIPCVCGEETDKVFSPRCAIGVLRWSAYQATGEFWPGNKCAALIGLRSSIEVYNHNDVGGKLGRWFLYCRMKRALAKTKA